MLRASLLYVNFTGFREALFLYLMTISRKKEPEKGFTASFFPQNVFSNYNFYFDLHFTEKGKIEKFTEALIDSISRKICNIFLDETYSIEINWQQKTEKKSFTTLIFSVKQFLVLFCN